MALRRIDRVLVQGKSQPVVLYEVLDADTPERRAAKRRTRPISRLGCPATTRSILQAPSPHFEAALAAVPSDTVAALLLERARRFADDGGASAERGAVRVEKIAAG